MAKDNYLIEFDEPCIFGISSNSGVYAVMIHTLYNDNKRCVYIGSSKNIHNRVMSPADVIMRLRRFGYNIEKEWIKTANNKKYAIYKLNTLI
jgi:excinuclease UvrABC nuclease subunit